MRALMLVPLLCACGRLDFSDPIIDAGPGGDGHRIDGMVVGPGTTGFGETPTATVTDVTTDTSISSEAGSTMNNRGASTSLECEAAQKRTLLRFDLSALAPGTPITSATLHLEFGGTTNGMATISPVLEAWTEGTQIGGAGVANNLQRTTTANWTTAGAEAPGSAGASIASFTIASGANTTTLPTATIQGWVNDGSTNFGVVIACSGDSTILAHENAMATSRPELDVTHQ